MITGRTQDLNVPALGVVKIPNGDTFIFYYEAGSKISYYRGTPGSYSAQRVKYKDGNVSTEATGSNSPLSVAVYQSVNNTSYQLRLYYIASDSTINELCLSDISKNNWERTNDINAKKLEASTRSGLSALSCHDVGQGKVELYFMDKRNGDKMTRAWSFWPEGWKKEEIS